MTRIYINDFTDPSRLWSVDSGNGTEEKCYADVVLAGCYFSTACDLSANPDTQPRAWLESDWPHKREEKMVDGRKVLHLAPRK